MFQQKLTEMRVKTIVAAFMICALFPGCFGGGYGGFIYTLHTEDFPTKRREIKKVICIAPQFHYFTDGELEVEDYSRSYSFKNKFEETVKTQSKRNGFNYELVTSREAAGNSEFYTRLLPLRRSILQSIRNQSNPLNDVESRTYKKISNQVFIINTLLPPELSQMAQQFGTPYFAIIDVYSSRKKSYLIHIIANVQNGRIEYQEIKLLKNKVNNNNLAPLMYDSFYFLKKSFR